MVEIDTEQPNFPQIYFADEVEQNSTNVKKAEEVVPKMIEMIKKVYDPEIPVDVYELGLIYAFEFLDLTDDEVRVQIDMTLTAPSCPVAGEMPGWVQDAVLTLPEIKDCNVDLVWEPFWSPEKMSLRAKLELNML